MILQFYLNHIKRLSGLRSGSLIPLFVFALLLLTLACDDDSTSPEFESDPEVTMAPNESTPLAALLELETDEPTSVRVTISENTASASTQARGVFNAMTIEFDALEQRHSLPLLGFFPGRTFSIEVAVTDRAGNETVFGQPIVVSTDPLPEDFPPLDIVSSPEKMEPGVTLFDIGARGANQSFGEALIAVNHMGDVVWYHRARASASDARMLPNGNILFLAPAAPNDIIEMDMLGNVVSRWHSVLTSGFGPDSIPVLTESFHHEVFYMENGNLLTLSVELEEIDGYPSSDSDPEAPLETAFVAGDLIVEFARDGTIVNEWAVLDMLDPFRIGYGSLSGFWNNIFSDFADATRDWSHGNAVIHDPSDDSIIVSLRNIDAVIKFSRQTGELIWILGTHQNWDLDLFGDYLLNPIGPEFLWQYHQHAPTLTPEGDILLFDNGNFRASPFDVKLPPGDNFSRAVQYRVDEANMEITQVWEYGEFAQEILYTPFIGDADYMTETGNVLITFGGITQDAQGFPSETIGDSKVSAKVVEVTHEIPAEVVFEMSITDTSPDIANGWTVYRAERLPGLYPDQ